MQTAEIPLGQFLPPDTGVMKPHPEDSFHIQICQDQILFELPSAGNQLTLLIEDQASSIKNQLILAAYQIAIGDNGKIV